MSLFPSRIDTKMIFTPGTAVEVGVEVGAGAVVDAGAAVCAGAFVAAGAAEVDVIVGVAMVADSLFPEHS